MSKTNTQKNIITIFKEVANEKISLKLLKYGANIYKSAMKKNNTNN